MAFVHGVNPVIELLLAQPGSIECIFVAQGARVHDLDRIYELARNAGVRVEQLPRERVARLAEGEVHQGIVAEVQEVRYAEPEDLLALAHGRGEVPLLVALDQVQDPVHLGTALRAAHALGGHGVIIPKDRAVGLTPAAIKASAGASAHLPVARATNLARTLDELKEAGVWIIGADLDAEPCDRVDLRGPVCLVIGSEGKGMRPLTRQRCDRLVTIPMGGKGASSLSASSAASILLYEVARQRRAAGA
ncbi:23S rRNA (guanosine(2251)-2'-O)-methyltransferase RlmB [Vulgatibacter incomptus]|uniref:23S rRNA (Guanosine-2'-O-)-methyltransferase rlmB n=1 Tax=Vulgatibacter incomptus TaxID=1391653 RepID=A0A0K1PDV5_9BACT|nr:23S rRNA (guanosine(2251)-2'-O)-methyltransferase RlmB [Vulgatibacter incomptus]AKU91692.1 23S rRNA (guanosine-2'-O-) -methyltransferase rlmB [Vulgatibacter incomptus]